MPTEALPVVTLVFAPLIGALVAGLFGRLIGHRAAMAVTTGLLVLSAVLAWTTFLRWWGGALEPFTYALLPFITVGELQSAWSVRLDGLSVVMLIVVTTVSALVHVYSWGYMADDPGKARFFAYLSLFTFAMLMLVTAADFMQLFFGWEGVGLASYLLIGFWWKKPSANAAAVKAFVVNRVGDFGFALGIMTVFWMFGSIEFAEIFPQIPAVADRSWIFAGIDWRFMDVACLLLLVGAMGKSAQFFLHTWLPDAMEGPTPVSALIHAATMVTAGVYMLCLLSPMFQAAPAASNVVILVGAVTALFAATVGLAQNDIKRVIAYSTCSQLGYMFFAAGVGAYQGAMFHLFTHAFFKALLFLGAGSVIHGLHHEQDMRRMGGLARYLPMTYGLMMIGTIAITGLGIPGFGGFAGFYSKDIVIESAYAAGLENGFAMFAFVIGVLVAGLTSFYSFRLIFFTFHGQPRWADAHATHAPDDHGPRASGAQASGTLAVQGAQIETHSEPDVSDHGHAHGGKPHESPWIMLLPLFILAIGAISAGFVFEHSFVGDEQGEFWRGAIAGDGELLEEAHHVPAWVLWSPLIASLIGLAGAAYVYLLREGLGAKIAAGGGGVHAFLYNKWWFDELYQVVLVRPAAWIGEVFWRGGDRTVIDGFGPNGIAALSAAFGRRVGQVQTGYMYHYAFVMLLGVAGLLTYALVVWA